MKTNLNELFNAAKRDLRIWSAFYNKTTELIQKTLSPYTLDSELILDVTHDCLEKLYYRQSIYDETRGSLEAFVVVMARNKLRDYFRKRGTHRFISLELKAENEEYYYRSEPVDFDDPEKIFMNSEFISTIKEGILLLPPRQAAAFESKYFVGEKASETAKRMKTTKNAIGTHISRARTNLQKYINKHDS